jgi:hypothetical protein
MPQGGNAMPEEVAVKPPPYLPLKTFLSALDALREGVPPKIDRGIWRSQSGASQGQIMITLRFFGLLNDADVPKLPLLEDLAKADELKRKKLLKPIVEQHYRPIIAHDLTKMTAKMLDEAMEGFGVNGDTRRKAIGFFLQMAKYLELPLSPFLTDKIRNSPAKRRSRTSKSAKNGADIAPAGPTSNGAHGSSKSVSLRGSGTVTMTVTADVWKMSSEDRTFVLELIDKIQGYEKASARVKPKEKAAGKTS